MLGLGLSLSLGSTGGSGGIGAPQLFSTLGTTQGTVLTVSSGATLYRNGLVVSAPYTTDADDALAIFWAQVGATRSASIEIETAAVTTPSYSQLMYRVRSGQFSAAPVNVDTANYILTQPNGTPYPMVLADLSWIGEGGATTSESSLAALIDGDPTWTSVRYTLVTDVVDAYRLIHKVTYQPWATGSFQFSAYGNFQGGPGHIELYGDPTSDQSADPANLAEWELISDYNSSWDYSSGGPVHTIGGAAVSLGATWDDATNVVTLDLSGFSATAQAYVRNRTETDYPVSIAPYTDWTTVTDGMELDASVGGNWEILYRDSDTPDEVYATGALLPVFGLRPRQLGITLGAAFGRPYYVIDHEMFSDLMAYQSALTYVGGALDGVDQKGFDGTVQGANGGILSWPAGGVTAIRLWLSATYYGQNTGMHELLALDDTDTIVFTRANYGTLWTIGGGTADIELTDGPNGGPQFDLAHSENNHLYLQINDDAIGSLPTKSLTWLPVTGATPGKELTSGYQADIDRFHRLRWGNFPLENWGWWSWPDFPTATTMAAAQAELATITWTNRREKGSVVETMAEAGHEPYFNFSPGMSDDYITNMGAFFAANNTNPAVSTFCFSMGFECFWNYFQNPYQRTATVLFQMAIEQGLLGATPDYIPQTVVWHATNAAAVSATHANGTLMLAALSDEAVYGPVLYEKVSATTGATTLPIGAIGTTNGDWTIIADLTAAGLNGRAGIWRAGAKEMNRIRVALQAGLGSDIRAIPGFEGFCLGVANHDYGSSDPAINPIRAGLFTPMTSGGPCFYDACEGYTFVWPAPYTCATWSHAEAVATGWDGTAAGLPAIIDSMLTPEIASGQLKLAHGFRPLMASIVSTQRTDHLGNLVRGDPAKLLHGFYETNTSFNSDTQPDQDNIQAASELISMEAPYTRHLVDMGKHGGNSQLLGHGGFAHNNGGNWNTQRYVPFDPAERGKLRAINDYLVAHPNE